MSGNDAVARSFGENLKRQRELAGISQDELSVMASLHRTEVSQLERGLRVARIDTLVKLAACLEVSPDELLEGIHWHPGAMTLGQFRAVDEQGQSA